MSDVKGIVSKILEGADVRKVIFEDTDINDIIKTNLDDWLNKYVDVRELKDIDDVVMDSQCFLFKWPFRNIYVKSVDGTGNICLIFEKPYGVYPADAFWKKLKESLSEFGLSWDVSDKKSNNEYVDDGRGDVSRECTSVDLFNIRPVDEIA